MPCPRCQHQNPSGQKFCGECGARLAAPCSACGASNPPDQKFCGECGTALTGAATLRQFGAPESYTPKHLAEKILTSKAALEGERKQVTVLFADLKGSMELLAAETPRKLGAPRPRTRADDGGRSSYTIGEYEKAVVYLRLGAELSGGERLHERFGMAGIASVLGRHWLARALAQLGEFSEGFTVAQAGLDINLSTDITKVRPCPSRTGSSPSTWTGSGAAPIPRTFPSSRRPRSISASI
jgi:hypothetical protein